MFKTDGRTLIIAEAGVNHNGDIEIAKKLIDAAEESGADYVKFQTFKAEKLASQSAPKARYQNENDKSDSQFEMLKRLEIDRKTHDILIDYCKDKKTNFLSTPFDEESADLLHSLVDFFKVPSGELTNFFLLKHLAQKAKPIIISTGMAQLGEVAEAISLIEKTWKEVGFQYGPTDLAILQCNTQYPTPFEDCNLRVMETFKKEFPFTVGYSDHSLGIEAPIAAVALGAHIIEKHFTLDRTMEGPDHAASLEPQELSQMVSSIRNIELSLGRYEKTPSCSEKENINIARKSLHLNTDKMAGEVLKREDLIMLRPGGGIHGQDMFSTLGKTLKRDLKKGELLSKEDLV